ncbi:MAG: glycoside hydrolase family 43 protein [Bacteroidota bacterium]
MKNSYSLLILITVFSCHTKNKEVSKGFNQLLKSSDIRVRDPFILAEENTKTYYLYASISNRTKDEGPGVEVYTSKDLQHWTPPQTVFEVPENFWATKWVWAPEVHYYNGNYYLFTTFTANDTLEKPQVKPPFEKWPQHDKRGSQILVADSPIGPFKPFSNEPHLTEDWMTLDGTLWVEDNQPYMIYCHEWVQVGDGTMDLIALKEDLSATEGENHVLFKASDAPWVKAIAGGYGYVTDGCFVYKTRDHTLLIIWSSIGKGGYSIGTAISESGSIKGPWKHLPDRIFEKNGGHGMIFKTFENQLVIALHQPNKSPNERMQLYKLKDTGEALKLDGELF